MEFDLFNNRMNVHYEINLQGGGKVGLQLYVKQFILVLWFISYYIIFHKNNYKPTFAPPYILDCVGRVVSVAITQPCCGCMKAT